MLRGAECLMLYPPLKAVKVRVSRRDEETGIDCVFRRYVYRRKLRVNLVQAAIREQHFDCQARPKVQPRNAAQA